MVIRDKAEVLTQNNYDWLLVYRLSTSIFFPLPNSCLVLCGHVAVILLMAERDAESQSVNSCPVRKWLLCNWSDVHCVQQYGWESNFSGMIHRVFFIPNSSKNWVFWNFLRGILQKFPFRSIKTLSFLVLFGNRALWIWLKALEQDKEKLPTRYNSLKKDWRCIVPEHWDRTGQYFWNRCFGSLLK